LMEDHPAQSQVLSGKLIWFVCAFVDGSSRFEFFDLFEPFCGLVPAKSPF
jgi:hypothetical protein